MQVKHTFSPAARIGIEYRRLLTIQTIHREALGKYRIRRDASHERAMATELEGAEPSRKSILPPHFKKASHSHA